VSNLECLFANLQSTIRGARANHGNVVMLIDQSMAEVQETLDTLNAVDLGLTEDDVEYCLTKIRWRLEDGNPFQKHVDERRQQVEHAQRVGMNLLEILGTIRLIFDTQFAE
jgi:RNA binding exosome subunit